MQSETGKLPTILVVDDEQAIVALLYDVLSDSGYHVLTASNGREALQCLERERADLVLSDVMMPVMDGLALYQAIQRTPAFQSIPVILMSAVAVFKGHLADIAGPQLLTKPFDLDSLLATIEQKI